jgi:hypothetical protein
MFKYTFHDDIHTEKDAAGVTRFRISAGRDMEKWINQNSAEYTGDFSPGCLLDNFVMVTRRGYAAFYENVVNCWTSDYFVEFQPGPAQDVFRKWYAFETENALEA